MLKFSFLFFLLLISCSSPFLEDKLYCESDLDCVCGGMLDGECFLGNKHFADEYVDFSKSCPDFCSGIAGNMISKCVSNSCRQVVVREVR